MKLPVFQIVANSFVGAVAAFRSIPTHFFAVFVLFGALDLATEQAVYRMGDYYREADKEIVRDLLGLLFSVATVPFAIAVHRFNMLGERMDLAGPFSNGSRLTRYLVWSAGLSLFAFVPSVLNYAFPDQGLSALLALAAAIFIIIAFMTAVPLFAAIALDDPEASFSWAAAITRGNRWRLFGAMITLIFAFMALLLPVLIYRWTLAASGNFVPLSVMGVLFSAAVALIMAFSYAAAVVFCNEVYRRLRQPA